MEAGLYNLWPENGLVNQARSNYRFGMVGSAAGHYGCGIKIDKNHRTVEPGDNAKGVIARAYLFMSDKYSMILSDIQR